MQTCTAHKGSIVIFGEHELYCPLCRALDEADLLSQKLNRAKEELHSSVEHEID
jgi:hypothetical protein